MEKVVIGDETDRRPHDTLRAGLSRVAADPIRESGQCLGEPLRRSA
jgi:hypothetical protein